MTDNFIQRVARGVIIGILASASVWAITLWLWPGVFDAFESRSLDIRYLARLGSLWQERNGAPIDDIIIIDIDNRSLDKLGQFNQWPRTYHARLVDYATQGGALAVGFDLLFLEPQRDESEDQELLSATINNSNVHHALTFSSAEPDAFLYPMDAPPEGFNADRFTLPANQYNYDFITMDRFDGKMVDLYNGAAGVGYANFSPDNDSVIRYMPMYIKFADRLYPSFSLSIVLGALGASTKDLEFNSKGMLIHPPGAEGQTALQIPLKEKTKMLINYQGTFQTFRYISYYDVLMQRVPKEVFNGRIVLVGTSAAGLSDIRPVPFQDAFPGVEIHANIIHNILTQNFIRQPNLFFSVVIIILISAVISFFGIYLKPLKSSVITIAVLGFYAYLSVALFSKYGYWMAMVRPMMAILLAYLFVFMYRFMHEERDKQKLKNMFKHYVTASVVDEMLQNPDLLKLGGDRKYATALFTDIESFTTISESMQPEKMVSHLNEYLTAMTNIILKYEGYLDKYEGDAIMAIFGVPVEQPDHTKRACRAALEMQAELEILRKKWKYAGKPQFHTRVGINSGSMIAGNIGGTERFDYTVIGDSVNLASRLEGVNRSYGTSIIISEYTRNELDDAFVVRELDQIRVKGKHKPVRIYELLKYNENGPAAETRQLLKDYADGLEYYREKQWQQAISQFNKVLAKKENDIPSNLFIERCQYFMEHPTPQNWDGVFDMQTK